MAKILSQMPDGILLADEKRPLYFNNRATKLLQMEGISTLETEQVDEIIRAKILSIFEKEIEECVPNNADQTFQILESEMQRR